MAYMKITGLRDPVRIFHDFHIIVLRDFSVGSYEARCAKGWPRKE